MTKILIVDDEKSLRITLSTFLKKEGHSVQTAECVEEAKSLLDKYRYSLVFSDILMEDGTGVEVLAHAKKVNKSTQVILITGYPNLDTATDALRLGAFDYLTKPVLKESFLKIAASALTYHEAIQDKEKLVEDARTIKKEMNQKIQSQQLEIQSLSKTQSSGGLVENNKLVLNPLLNGIDIPQDSLNLDVLINSVVKKAYQFNEGNKQKTARYLCITRDVLRSKLKHLELEE